MLNFATIISFMHGIDSEINLYTDMKYIKYVFSGNDKITFETSEDV